MAWQVVAKRQLLLEKLADVDEEVAELYLLEEEPTVELLMTALRRQTIARNFVPVCMGSAFKNKVALTYYLLLATHYLLLTTQYCYSLLATCDLLLTTCTHYLLLATCHLLTCGGVAVAEDHMSEGGLSQGRHRRQIAPAQRQIRQRRGGPPAG